MDQEDFLKNADYTHFTLEDWLQYIAKLHHRPIDMDLSRMREVAERLGINRANCFTITVTGTNGKGSTVALLEAALLTAGYRVGAYYSPHLIRFNERIRLNGQDIDDVSLCAAFQQIENVRNEIGLTYFEMVTLAAFLIFQRADLECVILEVGLGGRLDAVNILDADLAVITSIGLDHTDYLGPNRESIGSEKSGIMRAQKPVVCGDPNPPFSVIECAAALKSPLLLQNHDFYYELLPHAWNWFGVSKAFIGLPKSLIHIHNASTVLMVLEIIAERFKVPDDVVKQVLTKTKLPGRCARVDLGPDAAYLIFDVAHNPHAIHYLSDYLAEYPVTGKTHAVFSMLADKDIKSSIKLLQKQVDYWYIAPLEVQRSADLQTLQKAFTGFNYVSEFQAVSEAYQAASTSADKADRILIFGSFHTVGAVLNCIPQGFPHSNSQGK